MRRQAQWPRRAAVALALGAGLWCLAVGCFGVGDAHAQQPVAPQAAASGDIAAADAGHAAAFERVRRLARSGAPNLAVGILETLQPDYAAQPEIWEIWERERLLIRQSWSQWRRLADRVGRYPDTLTPAFRAFAWELAAQARLALADGARARQWLLRLQLAAPAAAGQSAHARWRRMVIRAYLTDGAIADADRAMVRYQAEFGDLGDDWPLLRASVLLKTGQAELAEAALTTLDTEPARLLRWYAQALADPDAARRLLEPVRQRLKVARTLPAAQQAALFALRALLARQMSDLPTRARYLEQALGVRPQPPPTSPLAPTADSLWAAYLALGQAAASEAQLLIGDDRRWYRRTEALLKQAPVRARALLALLVINGQTAAQRNAAADRLARSLAATPAGQRVLRRLFMDSRRFAQIAQIPPSVRFHLTDQVLADGDMALATQLVADLDSAAAVAADYDWQLRRARILVLGGRAPAGAQVLQTLLKQWPERVRAEASRFQQIIFDLQTLERHDLAVALFRALLATAPPPQTHRELLFWLAESERALGRLRTAAELFLQSAGYHDPFSMDPWAQTARFYAAETLTDAGLTEDARLIYRALLAVTDDQARQSALRQRLQHLLLIGAGG